MCWDLGCGGSEGDSADAESSSNLYDPGHVLEVEIEMDPEDWDALRLQTRDGLDLIGEGCLTRPPGSPFTYFDADVTLDGRRFERVGVRKKGFYGSLSDTRPSLKVKLDHFVDDQETEGIDILTLNNNLSDPSQVKQCIGYQRFRDAGLPASRCTLAVVSVNGARLGVYSNVESIDKAFLRRNFDHDEGSLYEGALSDFRPHWVDTFEQKGDTPGDRADLEAVVAALEVPDEDLERRVGRVVELEQFYDFWALEVLLMHADGYTRQTNNSFVYRSPENPRFTFIPWGIDVILQPDEAHPWEPSVPPGVAWAEGALARRLYLLPKTRDRYLARLEALLDEVWWEEQIVEEIDGYRRLLEPYIAGMPEGEQELIHASIDDVLAFVAARRGQLTALLDAPPATWDRPLRDSWCLEDPEGDVR